MHAQPSQRRGAPASSAPRRRRAARGPAPRPPSPRRRACGRRCRAPARCSRRRRRPAAAAALCGASASVDEMTVPAEGQRRQRDRLRAGGEQQVLAARCAPRRPVAGVATSTVLPSTTRAQPWTTSTAVLLQQRRDAAGEPRDDAVLPAHRLREVDARRVDADAERRPVARSGATCSNSLGGVDQRLGRNAADVEAGAAERARPRPAWWRCPAAPRGSRDVAAGAAADDEQRGRLASSIALLHEQRRRALRGSRAAPARTRRRARRRPRGGRTTTTGSSSAAARPRRRAASAARRCG